MDENMKECIKRNILCIVSLCRKHCEAGCVIPQMKTKSGIRFVLLQMAIFLSLSEENLKNLNVQDVMEKIRQILLNEYVLLDKDGKFARIVGHTDNRTERNEPVNCYMWSLFMYTYSLNDNEQVEKNRFLWAGIIFPYIYRLNCFGDVDEKELRDLFMDYHIIDSANSLKANWEVFKEFNEFSNLFRTAFGMIDAMPTRVDQEKVLANSAAGWEVLKKTMEEY